MTRFGQHSKVTARSGRTRELVAKFIEAGEIQRDNPACELMFVSTAGDDVYLTEVWASEQAHRDALESDEVAAWAAGMPDLVAGEPRSERFEPVGGKGL